VCVYVEEPPRRTSAPSSISAAASASSTPSTLAAATGSSLLSTCGRNQGNVGTRGAVHRCTAHCCGARADRWLPSVLLVRDRGTPSHLSQTSEVEEQGWRTSRAVPGSILGAGLRGLAAANTLNPILLVGVATLPCARLPWLHGAAWTLEHAFTLACTAPPEDTGLVSRWWRCAAGYEAMGGAEGSMLRCPGWKADGFGLRVDGSTRRAVLVVRGATSSRTQRVGSRLRLGGSAPVVLRIPPTPRLSSSSGGQDWRCVCKGTSSRLCFDPAPSPQDQAGDWQSPHAAYDRGPAKRHRRRQGRRMGACASKPATKDDAAAAPNGVVPNPARWLLESATEPALLALILPRGSAWEDDYTISFKTLGVGKWGTVKMAVNRHTAKKVAFKVRAGPRA
jgi:hypothetical protein